MLWPMRGRHGWGWMRSVLVLCALLLSLAGCSTGHAGGQTSSVPASSITSTSVAPNIVPNRCPENRAANVFPPDQVSPASETPGQILRIVISPFPEGPGLDFSDGAVTTDRSAFDEVLSMLEGNIPQSLDQSCCPGGVVVQILFENGDVAIYGPCDRPETIESALSVLYRSTARPREATCAPDLPLGRAAVKV